MASKRNAMIFREVMYLSAFAQLGVLTRAYLGRCTASPLSFPGANFFPDMPANVIGSAIIGLLASSQVLSDSGVRTKLQDVSIAVLPSSHPWQLNSVLQLGLRTGYCGSLTTFASWISSMVQSALFLPTSGCHAHWVGSLWGLFIGTTLALSSLLMGQHLALWIRVQLQKGSGSNIPADELIPSMQILEAKELIEKGTFQSESIAPSSVEPTNIAATLNQGVEQDEAGTQQVPTSDSMSPQARLDAAHQGNELRQQQSQQQLPQLQQTPHQHQSMPQSSIIDPHSSQQLSANLNAPVHMQEGSTVNQHFERLDVAQRSKEQQGHTESVPALHVSQPRITQDTSSSTRESSALTPGNLHTSLDPASIVLHVEAGTANAAHQTPHTHINHHAQQQAKLALFDRVMHSFCCNPPHHPHSSVDDQDQGTHAATLCSSPLWCGCTVRDVWDVAADVTVLSILLGLTGWSLGSLIAPAVQGLPVPDEYYLWLGILFGPFGCLLRWQLAALNYSLPRPYHWLPLGTLCANLLACMLDFGMAALLAKRGAQMTAVQTSAATALVLGVGGCLSTVSTWVAEIQKLSSSFPDTLQGYAYLILTVTSSVTLGILIYGLVMWIV